MVNIYLNWKVFSMVFTSTYEFRLFFPRLTTFILPSNIWLFLLLSCYKKLKQTNNKIPLFLQSWHVLIHLRRTLCLFDCTTWSMLVNRTQSNNCAMIILRQRKVNFFFVIKLFYGWSAPLLGASLSHEKMHICYCEWI